jgi:hypothetical protein
MALFQSSVIKKELQSLNQKVIDEKWNEFVAHFGNVEIQQKIRGLKEEQYQGEFLDDLFVKVLGYTKPPKPNHNLVTEQKNETNSKKADGAIIVDEKVVGVIELKGTNTTDLEKVKDQAFLYKVNHPECIYVITSNFEKLRFYIENTVDFIEFNLFQLSKKEFSLLYVCLSYENIKNNVPKHLKDESVSKESKITKQLYKDYSDFKQALFNNLVELNPQYDKLLLFKKTQKLLDRFLFIFFAEDRQLVPTNLIRRINLEWEKLCEMRIPVSLYDRYKTYFDDLNSGAKVTLPAFGKKTGDAITAQFEIFAYNGGLFAPDDVLDKVSIDDDLLHKHSLLLSDYDFESDVDVNILGHIFENSLNEIDEIKSEIEGQLIDKTKTKRKKDGVFYTPKYITKYIVDNTVGKLCTEKKAELKLVDEDYTNDQKIQTKTKKAHLDKLTDYRAWLLQLTICDPACGSGAFLNQALEFLIAEHLYVDELQAKLMGDSMILSDVETRILENNIYGVDLNDESVEIAKLSLWLRTAQKGRKLNSLNNNIKCGNSLIDDPEVAGEKAFNWQQEFPTVFENGGFDVVIGNPPYVDNRGFNKSELSFLYDNYPNSFKKSGTDKYKTTKLNLIAPFIELNSAILKNGGLISFIFHKNIFKTNSYTSIREFILNKFKILLLTDWGAGQFQDVVAETATFVLEKQNYLNEQIKVEFYQLSKKYLENYQSQSSFLLAYEYIFGIYANTIERLILEKIEVNSEKLEKYVNVNNGIVTGNDSKYLSFDRLSEFSKKAVRGKDLKRYSSLKENEYVHYIKSVLLRSRDENIFLSNEKLLMQMINIEFVITYDNQQYYNLGTTYAITNKTPELSNLKFILSILNSRLIRFYYLKKFTNESSLTNAISTQNLFNIPIKKVKISAQQPFVERADLMLRLNNDLQEQSQKFLNLLKSDFNLEKPSKKIEEFYTLKWSEFEKELNKNKIMLLGVTKDDWFDRFDRFKKLALELKTKIDQTDKEIDRMVYELYGLTEEDIQIVENS